MKQVNKSNSDAEWIKKHADIVDVVKQFVPLDVHNKGLCPFHDDKKASFSVSQAQQFFHCFACGVSGDVIKFVQLIEKVDFKRALAILEKQADPNRRVEAIVPTPAEPTPLRDDILQRTTDFYHGNLTPAIREYLVQKRGIADETIEKFNIGLASGGLRTHLVEVCGFPEDECIRVGVLKKTKQGNVVDYFNNRIIFPTTFDNKTVHLTGRGLNGIEPKYLHLRGEIKYLFNEAALASKRVFVTEGIPDCLTLIQRDIPAVGVLGTGAFKASYVPKFKNCDEIVLCFDGDQAGKDAGIRVAEMLEKRSKVLHLPDDTDVNEYFMSHSVEEFNKLVEAAAYPASQTEVTPESNPSDEEESLNENSIEVKGVAAASFDGLVDIADADGERVFIVKVEGRLKVVSSFELDGEVLVPPPAEYIRWELPRAQEVLRYYSLYEKEGAADVDRKLFDQLVAYHKSISELPSDYHYDFIGLWVIHTYSLEEATYSPILCLYAIPERGKSRTGKGILAVAYRGVHIESLREAYIFRFADSMGGTIFFDVMDIWKKSEKNQSEDMLLQRFEKGATVPRVLYPEKGAFRDTAFFKIFGPTIIGTNEPPNAILETRSVMINMPETQKMFSMEMTAEVGLPLKEQLVAFRAYHMDKNLPSVEKVFLGRLGDIMRPLHRILRLVCPEDESRFIAFVESLQNERKIQQSESLEAEILRIILANQGQVNHGTLEVRLITDALNKTRTDKYQISAQRVGRKLQALGFSKARTTTGATSILIDEKKLRSLAQRYGVETSSVTSVSSETAASLHGSVPKKEGNELVEFRDPIVVPKPSGLPFGFGKPL